MNYLKSLFGDPVADFPADISATEKVAPVTPLGLRAFWGLFAIALFARSLVAWHHNTICDDGYFYISVANALEAGEYTTAFHYLSLNLYPFILLGLHKLGLGWQAAGEVWGVTLTMLTLFPLFGIVRRLYSERIAILSCLLFAIHPEIVELSVEPIREQTFWFAITLFLYASYRALFESAPRMYFVAGLAFAAAAHLRTEGWFLLLPFVMWGLMAWRQHTQLRWQIPTRMIACLALTPCLVLLANVTLLRDHHEWELGRGKPVLILVDWVKASWSHVADSGSATADQPLLAETENSMFESEQGLIPISDLDPVLGIYQGFAVRQAAALFVRHLTSCLGGFNCLLFAIGTFYAFRTYKQRETWPIYALAQLTMVAIWIRLSQVGPINSRYFVTVVILTFPIQAYGLIGLARFVLAFHGWAPERLYSPRFMATAFGIVLVGLSIADSADSHHAARERQIRLGIWIQQTFGEIERGMVDLGAARVGFYAFDSVAYGALIPRSFLVFVEERNPEVLIVTKQSWLTENKKQLQLWTEKMGLNPIDDNLIPECGRDYTIYTRRPLTEIAGLNRPTNVVTRSPENFH